MLPECSCSRGIRLFVVGLISCVMELHVNAQANVGPHVHVNATPNESSEIPIRPPLREVIVESFQTINLFCPHAVLSKLAFAFSFENSTNKFIPFHCIAGDNGNLRRCVY